MTHRPFVDALDEEQKQLDHAIDTATAEVAAVFPSAPAQELDTYVVTTLPVADLDTQKLTSCYQAD